MTGSIGLLGTRPSDDLMQGCDTLLMVGRASPTRVAARARPGARRAGRRRRPVIGMRYPIEVNLVGDAADTLRALLPLLQRKTDRSWREEIEAGSSAGGACSRSRRTSDADPINPQRVFHELRAAARPRDPAPPTPGRPPTGGRATWAARRDGRALSGTLATMGPAIPYALAAKLAYPDRP